MGKKFLTAQEARELQLSGILESVKERALEGKGFLTNYGTISPSLKSGLEKLGYKVTDSKITHTQLFAEDIVHERFSISWDKI